MRKHFTVFWKYKYLLFNLISRDLKVKYRRSVLGLLWSVLNPLLMMLVITVVFSKIMRFEVPNFHLFYLTGALIFNFMSEATSGAMGAVIGAGNLIKKVYIPKYIFPLEKALFAFVNMLFSLIAVIIVMVFTAIFGSDFSFTWTMLLFWVPMIYVLIFSVGLSLLLAALTVFFRDILHLYAVVVSAWMYATPIIYPATIFENSPVMQTVMMLNPMQYYVTYFRDLVLYNTLPPFSMNLICLSFGLIMLVVGVCVFRAVQDRFVMHL